jgi:glycosyltransferase involved in cell wall biosynthesis
MKAKQINLLVLTRDYPNGMADTKRVQHMLYYLISQKIEINVISFRSKLPQPAEKGLDNGIPFLNIGIGLDFKLLDLHKIIAYFVKGFYLIFNYKKEDCKNIIYCYGSINIENILFIFWARLLRYKLVFEINEDYSFFEDQVKAISRFKIWTVKHLDFITYHWSAAIIVISTHLMNKYLKRNNKHIVLIPVTAKQNFNANKQKFNNPLQVVYAGSFDLKDGVNDIIEGFNSFNSIYQNARLILTGTGKSDQQVIYQEKYKSYSNIIFKGHVSDDEFYDLLKNADVMCMCRTNSGFANAGFPFKLGEYLATGNPVISTKASDVEKYLTADDAYLIEHNSPQQICGALTEIVNNPEEARKIGLNGMKKCQKFFSPEINGKLLYDLLITIVSE